MSKMPKSIEEVENKENKEEKIENPTSESQNDVITEVIDLKDIKNPEVEEKHKFDFMDLFKKENLKKGALWFLNSFIWLAVILFIGDMLTKYYAESLLAGKNPVPVIPGLLQFTLVYNKGAAWGVGDGAIWSRVLLCVISWVAMIGIIYVFIRYWKKLNNWYKASLMMILAGDVGNLIDRTFFFNRGVIDFLDITQFIPGFGVFNFADSCLVVGIIILMILFIVDLFKDNKKDKKRAKEAEEKIKNEREK